MPPSSNLHYHWFHVVRPKTSESSLSTMIELVCIDWTGLGWVTDTCLMLAGGGWVVAPTKNRDLTNLIPGCSVPNEIGRTVLLFLFLNRSRFTTPGWGYVLCGVWWGVQVNIDVLLCPRISNIKCHEIYCFLSRDSCLKDEPSPGSEKTSDRNTWKINKTYFRNSSWTCSRPER